MLKQPQLHYETVTPLLMNCLGKLMADSLFSGFILVGGTNLSLRFGHRVSDDIDLFTDAEYGSVDFVKTEEWLGSHFPYFDRPNHAGRVGFGGMYFIGINPENAVKLDLMYTDKFITGPQVIDGIRFATVEQIIAMKMEAISLGGRKKDWWDIHRLLEDYSLEKMIALHKRWMPYTHDTRKLLSQLSDFSAADAQPDPKCLLQKDWDLIKLDIIDEVEKYAG